jgi:hypothetical protein
VYCNSKSIPYRSYPKKSGLNYEYIQTLAVLGTSWHTNAGKKRGRMDKFGRIGKAFTDDKVGGIGVKHTESDDREIISDARLRFIHWYMQRELRRNVGRQSHY